MDQEFCVEKQDFTFVKERIIKTNELLLLYHEKNEKLGKATQAFKHLKINYESALHETKRLKLDNERLTDTLNRIVPKQGQMEQELNELKSDYAKVEERYEKHLIDSQQVLAELEDKVKQCTCEKNLLTASPSKRKTADEKIRELKQLCSDLKEAEHQLIIKNNSLGRKNKRLSEKCLNSSDNSHLSKELAAIKDKLQKAEASLQDRSNLEDTIESLKRQHKNEVNTLRVKIAKLTLDLQQVTPLEKECMTLRDQIKMLEQSINIKKTDFSTQTELSEMVISDAQVPSQEDVKVETVLQEDLEVRKEKISDVNDIKEMGDDFLDVDSVLTDIFREMIMPATMLSPMHLSSRTVSEAASPPPINNFELEADVHLQLIAKKPVPNIIVTPPTPKVDNGLSLQFPALTDLPVVEELNESDQNCDNSQVSDNDISKEDDNPLTCPLVDGEAHSGNASVTRDSSSLTRECINTGESTDNVESDKGSETHALCVTRVEQGSVDDCPVEDKSGLEKTSIDTGWQDHGDLTKQQELTQEGNVHDFLISLQESQLPVAENALAATASPKLTLSGSEDIQVAPNLDDIASYHPPNVTQRVLQETAVPFETRECSVEALTNSKSHGRPTSEDATITTEKSTSTNEHPVPPAPKPPGAKVRPCRKFWIPYSLNHFVKPKRKPKEYPARSHTKSDTILNALRTLQQNNINFTISNESIPLGQAYSCCPVLSPPKPEPIRCYKDTYSEKMSCWNSSCTQDNSLMMLRRVPQQEEPELLGFFSVKDEVVTPSASRMIVREKPKNPELQDLVKQLLNGLKELARSRRPSESKTRKRIPKARNRASEFNSETESELERLFRRSVLGRNRKLLAAAREQSFESTGESVIESESDVMIDSGLVTTTPRNDTDSQGFCSQMSPIPNHLGDNILARSQTQSETDGSLFSSSEKKRIADFSSCPAMISPITYVQGTVDKLQFSTPTSKLSSSSDCSPNYFKVPKKVPHIKKCTSVQYPSEDSLGSYKAPFCPIMISPLASSSKSSSSEGSLKTEQSPINQNVALESTERKMSSFVGQIRSSLCQKISFDGLDTTAGVLSNYKKEFTPEDSIPHIDLSIKTADLNCTLNDISISQLEVSSFISNDRELSPEADREKITDYGKQCFANITGLKTRASKRKISQEPKELTTEVPEDSSKRNRRGVSGETLKKPNKNQPEARKLRPRRCSKANGDQEPCNSKRGDSESIAEDGKMSQKEISSKRLAVPLEEAKEQESEPTLNRAVPEDSRGSETALQSLRLAKGANNYKSKKRGSVKPERIVSKEFISDSESSDSNVLSECLPVNVKDERSNVNESDALRKTSSEIKKMLRDLTDVSENGGIETPRNIDTNSESRIDIGSGTSHKAGSISQKDLFGELSDSDGGVVSKKPPSKKPPAKRGQNLKSKILKQVKGMVYAYGNRVCDNLSCGVNTLDRNKSIDVNGKNSEKDDKKINIVQDILITKGKTIDLMPKNSKRVAREEVIKSPPSSSSDKIPQTYARRRLKVGDKTSSNSTTTTPVDILSQVMQGMAQTGPKLQTKKTTVRHAMQQPRLNDNSHSVTGSNNKRTSCDQAKVPDNPTLRTEDEDPFWDCPKSPDIPEVPDRLPRLIPTKKPTPMPPSKIGVLMNKLMVFSSDGMMLDEVIREFAFQDAKLMVEIIIGKLSRDTHDKADTTYPPSPPMTITQRILLGFLTKLDRSTHPGILDKFLAVAEMRLYNKKTCELALVQPVVRLHTAVCKMRRDMDRTRRFLCESFYFAGDFAVPILFTVLTMWPDVLPLEAELSKYPLAKVIVQLTYLKECKEPGYELLPLRGLLNMYYGYPTERWSCEELFREILVEYIRNPSVKLSDFTLLIFLKNKPAMWVIQKIKENLMPLYRLVPDTNPNLKATLLILLANICGAFNRFDPVGCSAIVEVDQWFQELQAAEETPIVQRSLRLARARVSEMPLKMNKTAKKSAEQAKSTNNKMPGETIIAPDLGLHRPCGQSTSVLSCPSSPDDDRDKDDTGLDSMQDQEHVNSDVNIR